LRGLTSNSPAPIFCAIAKLEVHRWRVGPKSNSPAPLCSPLNVKTTHLSKGERASGKLRTHRRIPIGLPQSSPSAAHGCSDASAAPGRLPHGGISYDHLALLIYIQVVISMRTYAGTPASRRHVLRPPGTPCGFTPGRLPHGGMSHDHPAPLVCVHVIISMRVYAGTPASRRHVSRPPSTAGLGAGICQGTR